MDITIYSDGSSDGKSGGIGGWAYVILIDGIKWTEGSGSEKNATNNICEVLGATKGLEVAASYIASHEEVHKGLGFTYDVTLISDSQLALRWATREYEVKKYHLVPYIIALRNAFDKVSAKTLWQRGHQGEENNCRCDLLAKNARAGLNNLQQHDKI